MKSYQPDFTRLKKVLNGEKTEAPVLFEFIIGDKHIHSLCDPEILKDDSLMGKLRKIISAYKNAGFDFATVPSWEMPTLSFTKGSTHSLESKSQNEGALITDRETYEKYVWPDPTEWNFSGYEKILPEIPGGMKLLGNSNGGVLENVTELVGYENLCFMYLMDPELTGEIFNKVGSLLLDYYKTLVQFDSIGASMVNDDWGFKSQTMFPPDMMREYVFPWHKKIVETIHRANKPAILHSCGNLAEIMPEIIHDLKFDAKHSYEDEIIPVEEAWKTWHTDICIAGGIDMHFLATSTPEKVYDRCIKMLEMTNGENYLLGSGNSIPDFIPEENFAAMRKAARDFS